MLILQFWGSLISVKVMLLLTYVSSPPPSLSFLSCLIGVNPGIFGVLLVGFSFVSCTVIMSMDWSIVSWISSSIFVLIPFMLSCSMLSCFGLVGDGALEVCGWVVVVVVSLGVLSECVGEVLVLVASGLLTVESMSDCLSLVD